ncbi:MAG TPA: hypothetical protein VHA54_08530 [Solirubrobacterales bacterium]|nr:hypothetical protein [Solirubrobacterales bacterium]
MFSSGRSIGAFAAVLLGVLALAAPAGAAVRYAAPAGSGPSPCNPTPCSLDTAVAVAVAGDEVVLTPGTYNHPDGVKIETGISFGGQPGQAATLRTGADPLEVENPGAVVHDLRVETSEMTMNRPLNLLSGTVERVYADPAGLGSEGCFMETGILRDSVCRRGLYVSFNQPKSVQAHVANVTANPVTVGADGGATMNLDLLNTIALPRTGNTSLSGLVIDVSSGSSVNVTARNSSYNSVDSTSSTGDSFTFTPAGTNGNQTAPPQLVDPAAGDFRELPTSPTIGAGLGDPLSGALDLDGAPRIQGPCAGPQLIDIGAYEFPGSACPVVPGPGPIAGPGKVAIGKPKLLPGKGAALLPVTVSGGGTVALGGTGIVARQTVAHRGGTLNLLVKAKGRKAKALRRRGKVTVRPAVTFTLFGGAPATSSQPVTLKLHRPAKRASR